mgnify:CR=1 FL=1
MFKARGYYNLNQLCDKLDVSIWTIRNWYSWEKQLLKEGKITEPYLPQPKKFEDVQGKPRMWTDDAIAELKKYKDNIVIGRNGVYGKYTNPEHTQAKKYHKTLEREENNG